MPRTLQPPKTRTLELSCLWLTVSPWAACASRIDFSIVEKMIRQIVSLTLLAACLMWFVAYTSQDANVIATRLIATHGVDQAKVMAREGTGAVMTTLVFDQLHWSARFIGFGAFMGLLARLAVWNWTRAARKPKLKSSVRDEAGGIYSVYGLAFSHAPTIPHWEVADVSDIKALATASVIEREMLAAYRKAGLPADVDGYHGTTLFEHSLGVWQRAVEQYGACSLEAIVAVCHDAGKLLTIAQNPDGQGWTRTTPNHEAYNAESIRRAPSFWKIAHTERDLVMAAMHFMTGSVAASDVPPACVRAVQRIKVLDVRTTRQEVARRTGQVDMSSIAQQIVVLSQTPPDAWNINRSINTSAAPMALYLHDDLLLVSGRALRQSLADTVDAATASALVLNIPAQDWHTAYDAIAEAIKATGLGARIVNNVATETGWFKLRMGRSTIAHVIVLKTSATAAQKAKWGSTPYEIILTEARKS